MAEKAQTEPGFLSRRMCKGLVYVQLAAGVGSVQIVFDVPFDNVPQIAVFKPKGAQGAYGLSGPATVSGFTLAVAGELDALLDAKVPAIFFAHEQP